MPGRVQAPRAPTAMAEFLREAVGVEGRELSEELALNSSELRLSEASLRPLLMELLSSQLQGQSRCQSPLPSASPTLELPHARACWGANLSSAAGSWHPAATAGCNPAWHRLSIPPAHEPQ